MQVFWDVKLCHWSCRSQCSEGSQCFLYIFSVKQSNKNGLIKSKDEGNYTPDNTVMYHSDLDKFICLFGHQTPLVLSQYCSPADFEVPCVCVLHPHLCAMLCLSGALSGLLYIYVFYIILLYIYALYCTF
jgi:hypothetical protein